MIEAELFDGTVLEFPDGTDPETIRRVAREQTAARRQSAPGGLPAIPPEDVRDERGVPGGIVRTNPASPAPSFGERAIDTSAGVLGAPVDAMSDLMGALGLPTSEAPLMGSQFIGSALHGLSGTRERREMSDQGDASLPGAPVSQRAYSSFLNTPRAQELYLTNTYGPEGEGWRRATDRFGAPTDRKIVRNEDGSENLFNPPGIDMGDLAGMAGAMPDLLGAIFGGAASVPAYALGPAAGIPASAALSAAGAQLVGEPVGRLFPENREAEPSISQDVLPRAAGEAGADALIGAIFGGGARVGNAIANKARAPFARRASDPVATEFRQAADRLQRQGYDIAPLPSEEGAGGFIPRVEGFLEKLPGSTEKMRQYREAGDRAITRFQSDLTGGADANAVGRDAVSELSTQRQNLRIDRETALRNADDMIDASERNLTARQGPEMAAEPAGRQFRGGLERARQEFRDEARRLYDIARDAPGGRDSIVDVAPVREQVRRIREALPPNAEGGASNRFTPQGLSRFLTGVDDIAPTVTIDQARQMRSLIADAIDDKTLLPGVPERYLVQLQQAVSRSIDDSVQRAASPELRQALGNANRFYAQNIDRFARKGVAEAYREPVQPGYVEDNRLVDRLLSGRGNPGVIREARELMGTNSPEWAATRRNAIEQILDAGRDTTRHGRQVVNVDGLVEKLNRLDDETVRELFGIRDAQQLRNLAVDISNRSKYLDASALSQEGNPNILNQLRAAAVADDQIAREYRESAIASFLRGEDGAAARLKPEELVPWLYRRASPGEAQQIMTKLPPHMRSQVERGVVADIIESSISRGRGDMTAVRRLITDEASPADSQGIAELLGAGRDSASRQQADRVNALLSSENRQALRDLALITARRQERDATTQAVGGLAAGAAITNIVSSPGRALQAAIVSRGLAELITRPGVRRWLSNTRRKEMSPARQAQTTALAPSLVDAIGGAVSENADVQAAIEWLDEGGRQIGSAVGN